MNELGNYYVACVVFAAVYNQSPAGATGTMTGEYGGTDLSAQRPDGQRTAVSCVADRSQLSGRHHHDPTSLAATRRAGSAKGAAEPQGSIGLRVLAAGSSVPGV